MALMMVLVATWFINEDEDIKYEELTKQDLDRFIFSNNIVWYSKALLDWLWLFKCCLGYMSGIKDLIHVFANHCLFWIYLIFIVLFNKLLNSAFYKMFLTINCFISFRFVACGFLLPQQTIQIIGTQANLLPQLWYKFYFWLKQANVTKFIAIQKILRAKTYCLLLNANDEIHYDHF